MQGFINWINTPGKGLLSSNAITRSILAHYYLTEIHPFADGNGRTARAFEARMTAGSLCINDTMSQLMPADLPFGGVGESGHGRYRGRAGFDALSNAKAVLRRRFFPDLPFRYPPYTTGLDLLKRAYRWLVR